MHTRYSIMYAGAMEAESATARVMCTSMPLFGPKAWGTTLLSSHQDDSKPTTVRHMLAEATTNQTRNELCSVGSGLHADLACRTQASPFGIVNQCPRRLSQATLHITFTTVRRLEHPVPRALSQSRRTCSLNILAEPQCSLSHAIYSANN